MSAYRDVDRTALAMFAHHVEIAEALLAVNHDLGVRLATAPDPDLRQAYLQGWVDAWTQLAHARAIAVGLGRDTKRFDGYRKVVGDPYRVAAGLRPITYGDRVATVVAIRELRACVPEVVVVVPDAPRRLQAARPRLFDARTERLLWRLGVLVVLVVATLAVCATAD